MTRLVAAGIALSLVACTEVEPWLGDRRAVVVTPVAPDDRQEIWAREVAGAVAEWTQIMTYVGCDPPFVVGADGVAIRLIDESDWVQGDWHHLRHHYDPETGEIHVRDWDPHYEMRTVLLHELGHAMGLEHSELDGVMYPQPYSTIVLPNDAIDAAEAIGCEPNRGRI